MNDIYSKRVKDVMSRDVVSVHADENLHTALELMAENRIAALPVVDRRDHCVGILSTSDLVDVARGVDDNLEQLNQTDGIARGWMVDELVDSLGHEKIVSLMSERVATVGQETLLANAAREMLRNRVHRLPVLDQSERLVGIVSTRDLLEAFASGAPN